MDKNGKTFKKKKMKIFGMKIEGTLAIVIIIIIVLIIVGFLVWAFSTGRIK